ncbi:MAG: HAD family hydrolase [Magnetococcales bacterium]|nr:HAD family hydrolase [Magnetococcales bacterium]MBF0321426.1 HAD family hydrolase [Magnetococcales bacterium]
MPEIEIVSPDILKQKPTAVIFDTDNTLYDYEPAHRQALKATCDKAIQLLGISSEEFLRSYALARDKVKFQLSGTASSHSRLLYFQRLIEILGVRTQIQSTLDLYQTYWRTFLTNSKLFSEVREFIFDLRDSGIATAVVTDLTAQIQFRKLIYFRLDDQFDFVVTSEEAGADKPHEQPFRLAMEKLNVGPELVWMIGDDAAKDIGGARNMGMFALQKRHHGVVVDQRKFRPDIIFDTFGALRKACRQSGVFGVAKSSHNLT